MFLLPFETQTQALDVQARTSASNITFRNLMEHNVMIKSTLRLVSAVILTLNVAVMPAQTPTPAASPSPANPAFSDPMTQALEPVREAIGRQDYPAAQAALDQARRINPNHPSIPMYQGLIQRRQNEGQVLDTESPLRTPRPGVTPVPGLQPAPHTYTHACPGGSCHTITG